MDYSDRLLGAPTLNTRQGLFVVRLISQLAKIGRLWTFVRESVRLLSCGDQSEKIT